ncbi:MAG: hypothetical protein RLZZ08_1022 [Pseudomonadota bacterium]|jgi:hypothetical protein
MTIRFAAPADAIAPRLRGAAARAALRRPANDNGQPAPVDDVLHAALRHFAQHGLAAAQSARAQAELSFFRGDRTEYTRWLGICRALDRRLARELETGRMTAGN